MTSCLLISIKAVSCDGLAHEFFGSKKNAKKFRSFILFSHPPLILHFAQDLVE
jgi:hypothetical protein